MYNQRYQLLWSRLQQNIYLCQTHRHSTLLEGIQWNPDDNYEKPMNVPMKKFSLVNHIPWNIHGKPRKFSWPINEWVFMGTIHKKSMKIHEIVSMKMLGKAISRPVFHGFLLVINPWKLTRLWPMNAFHGCFMATGHPWKTPNATFIGSLMGFAFFIWEIHGIFSSSANASSTNIEQEK